MIDDTAEIHPLAIVEKGAKIGARTRIMEFAIIRAGAEIGEDNGIMPFAIIRAGVKTGKECTLMERVVLGAFPTNYRLLKRTDHYFGVKLGDRVCCHTSATVVCGITRATLIGDDSVLGQQVTIGHDSILGKNNRIDNHSTLAGYVEIKDQVRIHLNVTMRNRVKIGYYTEIGMGSNVTKDIPSNRVAYGNPCRVVRLRESVIKNMARRVRDGIS